MKAIPLMRKLRQLEEQGCCVMDMPMITLVAQLMGELEAIEDALLLGEQVAHGLNNTLLSLMLGLQLTVSDTESRKSNIKEFLTAIENLGLNQETNHE